MRLLPLEALPRLGPRRLTTSDRIAGAAVGALIGCVFWGDFGLLIGIVLGAIFGMMMP